ncbi:RNA polymerase sigma factor [Filimonas effusa]|uniref:RNA polymerase sigma factor n=1 Tax=Filimonas effusa TaxID=2508721 RepID=UPI0013E940B6|nr:sigma-70 family RNA polymerase sigma factor [Filimonas effusa]
MPSVTTYNEPELLLRIADGDRDAYRIVFEHYWNQIYAIGLKISKSPELARDLAQETFIKLWVNKEQLPDVIYFRSFLYTLARNLAIDHLRKKVFTANNEDYLLAYFRDDAANPHENAEYHELEGLLNRAVNNLPPQMQQVFKLSRFEGLSHSEIAVRMNITRVTSKSYMVRALSAIRKYMAQYHEGVFLLIWTVVLQA